MKTLRQKRQTSGNSSLKQATRTWPLRKFLKYLGRSGERQNGKPRHAAAPQNWSRRTNGEQGLNSVLSGEASVWATCSPGQRSFEFSNPSDQKGTHALVDVFKVDLWTLAPAEGAFLCKFRQIRTSF